MSAKEWAERKSGDLGKSALSGRAHEASNRAEKSKDPAVHKEAAQFHREAAGAWKEHSKELSRSLGSMKEGNDTESDRKAVRESLRASEEKRGIHDAYANAHENDAKKLGGGGGEQERDDQGRFASK
jgi:hypothetical protein